MTFTRKGSKLPRPAAQPATPPLPRQPMKLTDGEKAALAGRRAAPPPARAAKESAEIRVQKGIPLPPKQVGGRRSKYPYARMEIDDSFFLPYRKTFTVPKMPALAGRKFVRRLVTESGVQGVRVWRTE